LKYEVVNHLIETGTINKIKELHVEWHDMFFIGKKSSAYLKQKLKEINIIVNNDWI